MKKKQTVLLNILLFSVVGFALSGCLGLSQKEKSDSKTPLDRDERRFERTGKLFGGDGILFGGDNSTKQTSSGVVGSRVNVYLWKATLDALSFMPMISADASGGVLITDWYTSAEKSSERIKVCVEISSTELRVQSLKVRVYKQMLKKSQWINADETDTDTANELENIILNKARRLKMADR